MTDVVPRVPEEIRLGDCSQEPRQDQAPRGGRGRASWTMIDALLTIMHTRTPRNLNYGEAPLRQEQEGEQTLPFSPPTTPHPEIV